MTSPPPKAVASCGHGQIWPLVLPSAPKRRPSPHAWFLPHFFVVSSLSSSYFSAVVLGPILTGSPSFKGCDGCRHGHIWPLASKNCRLRFPAWFSLERFVCCGAYGPPLLRGNIMANALLRSIVLGVMLAATMVRCPADAAVTPKICYLFREAA